MRDPYSVLGVDRRADEGAIKSAFRKLAKRYHPDQNKDDPKAQARFAEVNQAYEIVGDKEKRARFDRGEIDAEGKERAFAGNPFGGGGPFGAGGPFRGGANDGSGFGGFGRARGGGGMGGAGMAEDILSEIFGGRMGGAGGVRGGAGGGGLGGDPFGGARQQARPRKGADVEVDLPITIKEAIGADRAIAILPDGRKLAVKLPQGVRDGQTIRLKGQGEPGAGGKGDARVTVRFKPHPLYRVDGTNLRVALEVPLEDAVLGAKLPVQTPSGRVAVTVPPMTGSDRTFRLKGRGLPLDANGSRGDLMVDVRVMLPSEDEGLTAWARDRHAGGGSG